jgi:hypothetical protein
VSAAAAVPRYRIEGHAIVSADDRIAGADGQTPAELNNAADWARFQAALDAAALVVLGRISHEANPNRNGRRRLIVSSSSAGIELRGDGWWWNPKQRPLAEAFAAAAPGGGTVAVPGGRLVFDLFLALGFDAFYLSRAERVMLPDGVPIFSSVAQGDTAAALLNSHGMAVEQKEALDPDAGVVLSIWRRARTLTNA